MKIENFLIWCMCIFLLSFAVSQWRIPKDLRGEVLMRLENVESEQSKFNSGVETLFHYFNCLEVESGFQAECTEEDIKEYIKFKRQEVIEHDRYLEYKKNNAI